MAGSGGELDETLYSRQLYVLGQEAAYKMAASDILISGLGGLGVEIAKNVILSGVKSVTLHDTKKTTLHDLSSQFFLGREDLGKNRAESCCGRLAELNPYVTVTNTTRPLTRDLLQGINILVLTDSSLEEQLQVSSLCRELNVALVDASTRGLFGQVFCDFGDNFLVVDPDGKEPLTLNVEGITREEEGVVTFPDKTFHWLQDGDFVTFSGIRGMTELNLSKSHKIKVHSPSSFSIGDTRDLPEYEGGGTARQVKLGKTMTFKSLKESLEDPTIICPDFAKEEEVEQVHVAFLALHQYVTVNGVLPRPWNDQDATEFLQMFYEFNETRRAKVENINEELLRIFAYTASGELTPMNAVIGSIAAQEVMKACSGKFTPLFQWLYFDARECLPEDFSELLLGGADPRGDRYDAQVAIFGRNFQDKLGKLKYFIVGAGAIGCELLKNFAMLGVGAGEGGSITVTDMDIIEKSNLNRQFLFRPWDIKKPKSDTAAAAVVNMNPDVHITAHQVRVGPETEHVYSSTFYESLHGVANALDNVEARRYMDRCCWQYQRPLLESGTLGTNGSVQVVVPHLTERYTLFQAPSDKSIPVCTLRNFPNAIEHTLQWARDMFEGEFWHAPQTAKQYITGAMKMEDILKMPNHQGVESINTLKNALADHLPKSYVDCVSWARQSWQNQFHDQILDLLQDFPPDLKTSNGGPFWSGSKRCPHYLVFDAENKLHLDYIHATANLKAEVYGIQQERDRTKTKEIVSCVTVAPFVPKHKVEPTVEVMSYHMESVCLSELSDSIPSPESVAGLSIMPLSFEKDDDANFHIDFIVAASNLRAGNYDIQPADRQKSKRIAGRIIPAIVTSTALVSGLVTLELLKVTQDHRDIIRYKNSEFNLGLCRFCLSEPEAAPTNIYNGVTWTLWDRFEVEGDITLEEFFTYFKDHHQLEVTMVSCGNHTIHSFMIPRKERARRRTMKISDILVDVMKEAKTKQSEGQIVPDEAQGGEEPWISPVLMLDICAIDREGEDVDVPHVRYVVRK
ncbi:ubiquitin-like modifier-activating enzyme 1 [Homarus americanus]|uniref:ubiquitin-like modifier-activating enzyme 1 n=1 Tax=Homarus americanus TaxID=6706 RepID=UPI001C44434C|nr:ubiquitin-like modifier-activating enzyme 1 [Homarus americanus]